RSSVFSGRSPGGGFVTMVRGGSRLSALGSQRGRAREPRADSLMIVRRLLLLALLAATPLAADFRAFWVEAFKTPLATQGDVDRVLDAAGRANANALFVQVRRRGDSWYIDSAEPLSAERAVGAPDADGRWTFDPLRYLIDAAHA